MAQKNFIFGGNTGLTYADLVRSRERANELLQSDGMPTTAIGGLGAIGEAFIGKSARDKANKALGERNTAFRNALLNHAFADARGGGHPSAPGAHLGLLGMSADSNYSPEQQNLAMELYRDRLNFERGSQERDLRAQLLEAQIANANRDPARKTIQGADGFQYYQDDGSRVLPDVEAPATDSRTTDEKNYDAAVDGGFKGTFNEWLLQKRAAGASNTNVSVNTGVDRPKPPAGYDYARTEDGSVAVDDNNAAQLVPIAGGPQAKELEEAEFDAEASILSMNSQLDVVDKALNHPGLDASVGTIQGRLPAVTNDQADFQALLAQIQGTVFLQAFESLKGGGQITQIEGEKAENAMARLNRVQSEAGFREALRELRDVIQTARDRLASQQNATTNSPSEDDIMAKYGIK